MPLNNSCLRKIDVKIQDIAKCLLPALITSCSTDKCNNWGVLLLYQYRKCK